MARGNVVIGGLLFNVNASTAEFEKAMKRVQKRMDDAAKRVQAAGAAMTKAFAPVTAAVTALAVIGANYANTLEDVSSKLKINAEALQALRLAAQEGSVDFSRLEKGLRNITDRTLLAAQGNKSYRDAIRALGYDTRTFLKLPLERKFEAVAKSYANATDKAEAHEAVMKLVGTMSGPELIKTLEAVGIEGFDALAIRARAAGVVLSKEATQRISDFVGKIDQLKLRIQVLGATIADSLITRWQKLNSEWGITDKIEAAIKWVNGLSETTKNAAFSAALMASAIGPITIGVGLMIKAIGSAVGAYGTLYKVMGLSISRAKLFTKETTAAAAATNQAAAAAVRADAANRKFYTGLGKANLGHLLAIVAAYEAAQLSAKWLLENAEEKHKIDIATGNEMSRQTSALVERVSLAKSEKEMASARSDILAEIAKNEAKINTLYGGRERNIHLRQKELRAANDLLKVQLDRSERAGGQIIRQNRILSVGNAIKARTVGLWEDIKRRVDEATDAAKEWVDENKKEIESSFESLRYSMLPDDQQLQALKREMDKISGGLSAAQYLGQALEAAKNMPEGILREQSILKAQQGYVKLNKLASEYDSVTGEIESKQKEISDRIKEANDQLKARSAAVSEYRALQLEAMGMGESARMLREEVNLRSKIADEAERLGISQKDAENLLRNELELQRQIAGVKEVDRALTREERKAAKDAERDAKRAEKRATREAEDPRIDLGDGKSKKRWSEMSSIERGDAQKRHAQGYGADGKIRPEFAAKQMADAALGSINSAVPQMSTTPAPSVPTLATQTTPAVAEVQKQMQGGQLGGGDSSLAGMIGKLIEAISGGNTQLISTISGAFPASVTA